jgi:oligopeptidase B
LPLAAGRLVAPQEPRPPVARRLPHHVASRFGSRIDWYHWMRDDTRQDPAVLAHLRAETAYAATMLAATRGLQQRIYDEIVGRIAQQDRSVPVFERGYWYYTRLEPGSEYPIVARRKATMQAEEQVLLDANERASGHAFYELASWQVSPDGRRLAFAEDVVGRNQFRVQVVDLVDGRVLPDDIAQVSPDLEWANDSQTLFYVAMDPVTLRERTVKRHRLGTAVESDAVVHDEPDDTFYVRLSPTKSRRYVQIRLEATSMSEVLLVDAARPGSPPRVTLPRERGHEYQLDHVGDRFVLRSNWQAENFRLVEVAGREIADRGAWRDILPHRADAFVEEFAAYRDFVAATEISGGQRQVRVLPRGGRSFPIEADEPVYSMAVIDTPGSDAAVVRYSHTSLATPTSTFEIDPVTRARTLLKRAPVRGDFRVGDYVTEYLHAEAEDGALVPVSLVRRRNTPVDGRAPLLLYGYGAYGYSVAPEFEIPLLSLLDRGWIYAIAHVRGGQELGRSWYDQGRLLHKRNTFDDFNAVATHLLARGYAGRDRLFAMGISAGGLLMGAILNQRPELYRGVIALVPFVDVVTTMLDPTIPLTTNEYDEWGDPRQRIHYDYMLSYSPYDNVERRGYPSVYVETGLRDSQVQYYEPAKWVARLRATRTDANPVLLHVNLAAGHGGKSGRYRGYREVARHWAFLLWTLARPDRRPGWPPAGPLP